MISRTVYSIDAIMQGVLDLCSCRRHFCGIIDTKHDKNHGLPQFSVQNRSRMDALSYRAALKASSALLCSARSIAMTANRTVASPPCASSNFDAKFFEPGFLRPHTHTHTKRPCYMRAHLFPPAGSPGFCPRSISPIMSSNAFATFSLYRALASVHAHLNSSPSARPSSLLTWRCSGRKSALFPTMTMGTESVPYLKLVLASSRLLLGRTTITSRVEQSIGSSKREPTR